MNHDQRTECQPALPTDRRTAIRTAAAGSVSGAATGGRGKLPPYGGTSKNYVICVCFHCHGTSSYHTTNTLQGRRAKSHVDTQTIQPGLGDFVLQTPYRPIPHFPLLQNPGGATGVCSRAGVNLARTLGSPGRMQWRRNYGDRGVHCTPKFRTCTPCTLQVKDVAYVKILSKRL